MWQLEKIQDQFCKLPQYQLLALAQFKRNLWALDLQLKGQRVLWKYNQMVVDAKEECGKKDVSPIDTEDILGEKQMEDCERWAMALRRLKALKEERDALKIK